MYVKDKDIDTFSALLGLLSNAIEGGADDEGYWQELSDDANSLFDKMKKQRDRNSFHNDVKKELTKIKKRRRSNSQ